jgi:hypothetical protein
MSKDRHFYRLVRQPEYLLHPSAVRVYQPDKWQTEFTDRTVAEVRSCKVGVIIMLLPKCDNHGSHKGGTLIKTCLKVRPSKHKNAHCLKTGPILTYERFVDYPPNQCTSRAVGKQPDWRILWFWPTNTHLNLKFNIAGDDFWTGVNSPELVCFRTSMG